MQCGQFLASVQRIYEQLRRQARLTLISVQTFMSGQLGTESCKWNLCVHISLEKPMAQIKGRKLIDVAPSIESRMLGF